jgi:hypothetical protein
MLQIIKFNLYPYLDKLQLAHFKHLSKLYYQDVYLTRLIMLNQILSNHLCWSKLKLDKCQYRCGNKRTHNSIFCNFCNYLNKN